MTELYLIHHDGADSTRHGVYARRSAALRAAHRYLTAYPTAWLQLCEPGGEPEDYRACYDCGRSRDDCNCPDAIQDRETDDAYDRWEEDQLCR